VAAHEVRKRSGFQVVFGPVRAQDIPAFLAGGMKATEEMRRVQFPLSDRLALVPVELVLSARKVLLVAACLFLLSGLGPDGYSAARAAGYGLVNALLFVGACWASLLLGPALLPWLPGRAFSVKGASVGLALIVMGCGLGWLWPALYQNSVTVAAWCLIAQGISSFAVLNFTGSSTFTSPSGARREMRVAVPTQAVLGGAGLALWLAGRFFP
jgi:acetyl-CoA decarbonylase/synthase complex subunit gamma